MRAAVAGAGGHTLMALDDAGLLGDLALTWSGELLHSAASHPSNCVRRSAWWTHRRGKCTVLMALAVARATPAQLRLLRALVGRPELPEDQADSVRAVLEATGARLAVERMIARRCRRAMKALDLAPFPGAAVEALRHLAHAASVRTS
ncbi:hypothetical protein ACFYWY_26490 [Streptomyces sp. NPDC002870]|uniref:hypothetical protein n=1 Tax=Streptomyces sp. NPDC002870 TaxID=3364666 RepID=UPI0036D14D66